MPEVLTETLLMLEAGGTNTMFDVFFSRFPLTNKHQQLVSNIVCVCLCVCFHTKITPSFLVFCHFRDSLPAPMFSRNTVSIWSILKKCIGLVRTCTFPVYFMYFSHTEPEPQNHNSLETGTQGKGYSQGPFIPGNATMTTNILKSKIRP